MKIRSDILVEAMKPLISIVKTKSIIPVLGGILLELSEGQLTIRAAEERLNMLHTIDDIEGEKLSVVIYPDAWNILASLGEQEIEIGYDEVKSVVSIVADKEKYKIKAHSGNEYVDYPNVTGAIEVSITLTGRQLRNLYNMGKNIANEKAYWTNMGSVCMDIDGEDISVMVAQETMFASEKMVAPVDVSLPDGKARILLPLDTLRAASKMSTLDEAVLLSVYPNLIVCYASNTELISSKTAETFFPPVKRVIDEAKSVVSCEIERDTLLTAITKLGNLVGGNRHSAKLTFLPTCLQMEMWDIYEATRAKIVIDVADVEGEAGGGIGASIELADRLLRSTDAEKLRVGVSRLSNGAETLTLMTDTSIRMLSAYKQQEPESEEKE
jgi:DNA polymerase III sliding clamp (beta) subunit (PCNA family)